MKTKQKQFIFEKSPREDFARWVREQFPALKRYSDAGKDYRKLEKRWDEVHEAAITVLDLTMRTSNYSFTHYYEDDLQNLKAAYYARDFRRYAKCLNTFAEAIERREEKLK